MTETAQYPDQPVEPKEYFETMHYDQVGFARETRKHWLDKIAKANTLAEMTKMLMDFRKNWGWDKPQQVRPESAGEFSKAHQNIQNDFIWIEKQMEDKTAVLRFEDMTPEEVFSKTLTGEKIADVCAKYLKRCEEANDKHALLALNMEFREKYKPPIMPTNDYMHTEMLLSEKLQKVRNWTWREKTNAELREEIGAKTIKAPTHSYYGDPEQERVPAPPGTE